MFSPIFFDTRVNTKLPLYVFPIPDPMAWKEDDFQHSWDDLTVYAFPPFTLLRQILLSVLISWKLSIILVAPLWPQKEWFANIISLLLDAARASSAVELASSTSCMEVSQKLGITEASRLETIVRLIQKA